MIDWLFYLFAALTLLAGFFTAFARGPVNAAMNMIVCLISVAAMMILLEAYFVAIMQVLVYAGAIVVLFLFIIMLIDAGSGAPRRAGAVSLLASMVALGLICGAAFALFLRGDGGPFAAISTEAPAANMRSYGEWLYTQYMLPFQLTGLMLLIAMVGVIVISRRLNKAQGGQGA